MNSHAELVGLIDRVLAYEPTTVTPLVPPVLRVDGVRHEPGDATVLRCEGLSPGFLPWSLHCEGAVAVRILEEVPELASGRPRAALAARLLEQLRVILIRTREGSPRFALSTIDRVEVGPQRVLLTGTCTLIVPASPRVATAAV